jgi:hypothetical protein
MFCYDESVRSNSFSASFANIDPNKQWEKHYSNLVYLNFIAQNKLSTFQEKAQAEREIIIAKRKIAYWERHSSFSLEVATQTATKIKKDWGK